MREGTMEVKEKNIKIGRGWDDETDRKFFN